jgi:hypothetical protein
MKSLLFSSGSVNLSTSQLLIILVDLEEDIQYQVY